MKDKMLSIDNKIYIIVSLIFFYTIWGFFSFKMYDSVFNMTRPQLHLDLFERLDAGEYTEHDNMEWFSHKVSGETFLDKILHSGVCRFGKFADNLNKIYIILGSVNLVLSLVYAILCFVLNKPLFYRCVPYIMIQFSLSIWLIEIGKTYEK